MASVCLEATCSRSISRQLIRHRSFTFQEFSQRYADPTESLGFAFQEARLQDKRNSSKQHRDDDEHLQRKWVAAQSHVRYSIRYIKHALGIAKEQARSLTLV